MKLSFRLWTIGRKAEKVNGSDEAKSEDLPVKTTIGFFGPKDDMSLSSTSLTHRRNGGLFRRSILQDMCG